MPDLRIVTDLPGVTEGTERVVEELTRLTTEKMAEAYVAGFKLGVEEALRILRDSGRLDAQLEETIGQLLARYEEERR